MSSSNYDVILLTETWLKSTVLSSELFDERYIVYRKNRDDANNKSRRKKDGGGVLIAVSRKLSSKRVINWESNYEDLWVVIDVPSINSIRQIALCAVYLPPPVHRTMLEHFLDNCNAIFDTSSCHYCILGDFNLGELNWEELSESSSTSVYCPQGLGKLLIDFINLNSLYQHNRVLNSSGRVLDLALSNLPHVIRIE